MRHWQHWLATELSGRGYEVSYPQLPEPDRPVPEQWVATIEESLQGMRSSHVTVVCHSLGCAAWMRFTEAAPPSPTIPVDHLLWVAPPGPAFLAAEPALKAFTPPSLVDHPVRRSARSAPRLACSDNDEYCKERADQAYSGLFDVDPLASQGHLDLDAGYGEWHSILDWCEDPTRRLTAR